VSQERRKLANAKTTVLALNYQQVAAGTGVHRNVAFRVRPLPPLSSTPTTTSGRPLPGLLPWLVGTLGHTRARAACSD